MWLVYRAISANPALGGQLPNRHVPNGVGRSRRHPSGHHARSLGSGRRTDRSVVSGMLGKWSCALFDLKVVYRVGRSVWGQQWTLPRVSHHVDPMLNPMLWIVGAPVIQASDQGLIVGTMVLFDQPLGDAAMLCLEHQQQRGDDAVAVDHGSFALVDEISLQGQGAAAPP